MVKKMTSDKERRKRKMEGRGRVRRQGLGEDKKMMEKKNGESMGVLG